MKVRILRGFAGYEPGQVFDDWPDGMCEIFIAKGMIERAAPTSAAPPADVEQEVAADESADVEPRTEKAELPARRKKAK